jgi:uncharacterized protein (DUF433 family)
MTIQDRIVIDPQVLAGKPVVRGTRLAVEFVIDLLAQGWSEADLLRNYPGLTHEDILACLAYAGQRLKAERIYPLIVAGNCPVRFLADEYFPGDAVAALRERGHDVMWIRTEAPGISDPEVLARAQAEDRLLLTFAALESRSDWAGHIAVVVDDQVHLTRLPEPR